MIALRRIMSPVWLPHRLAFLLVDLAVILAYRTADEGTNLACRLVTTIIGGPRGWWNCKFVHDGSPGVRAVTM